MQDLLAELRDLVGPANVLTGTDTEHLQVDHRGVYRGNALAVVRPDSTEQVSQVVKLCAAQGTAVVTQGGKTGMSGGSIAVGDRPSVVLSTTLMNAIESVNPEQNSIVAQAGVTIEQLQQSAASVGRAFAPDWGARGSATIGGGISTNAGGNNVLRHGTMRDQVLGLEVVLPDGRIWNGLRALRKDASGYDLKHLFIGGEGTLGIITRAVLTMVPATPHSQSGLAAIGDLSDISALYALANVHAPGAVTAFELIPDTGVQRVCEMFDLVRPIETRAEFYVLVKLASAQPVTDQLAEFLSAAAEAGLVTDAVVAATPDQETRLWTLRDELPAAGLYPLHQHSLKGDAAVPIDKMAEYHDAVGALAAELAPYALYYGFGHVGDGNLHLYVLPTNDGDVEPFLAIKPELQRRVDEITVSMGGTLSAEHGIGLELIDRLARQKSEIELELMRSVKNLFDPAGIMNPHKLLPPGNKLHS